MEPTTLRPLTPRPPVVRTAYAGGVELTDIPGAAQLAGVSERTIYNWIVRGRVKVCYTPSNRARVVVASLWKVEREATPEPRTAGAREPELATA